MDPFAKLTFGDAFIAVGLVVLFVAAVVVVAAAVVVGVDDIVDVVVVIVDDIVVDAASFSPDRSRCGERFKEKIHKIYN